MKYIDTEYYWGEMDFIAGNCLSEIEEFLEEVPENVIAFPSDYPDGNIEIVKLVNDIVAIRRTGDDEYYPLSGERNDIIISVAERLNQIAEI